MTRVAIAQEPAIERWALSEALARVSDLEIVGAAESGARTIELVRATRPDVLVLDATLQWATLLDELVRLEHAPHVVMFGRIADAAYVQRTIESGAHAYVSTGERPERLLAAIRSVSRGETALPPGVTLDSVLAPRLTAREQEVMELLARGFTNREIALHLGISVKTVDTHRGHVLRKLGLRNNAELVRFAIHAGYLSP